MSYQSIGSGGGIAQIKARPSTSAPRTCRLAEDRRPGCAIPGDHRRRRAGREHRRHHAGPAQVHRRRPRRHLPGQIRPDDKPIADLNPGVKLPADLITVVRRSDGSGHVVRGPTTCRRSARVEAEGRRGHLGRGAKASAASEGVAAYAADQGLDRLRRIRVCEEEQDVIRAGPEPRRQRAARRQRVPRRGGRRRLEGHAGLRRDPHRPARQQSWPVTSASFILMHEKQDKPANATECSSSSTGRSRTAARWPRTRLRRDPGRSRSRSPTHGVRRSRTVAARPSGIDPRGRAA